MVCSSPRDFPELRSSASVLSLAVQHNLIRAPDGAFEMVGEPHSERDCKEGGVRLTVCSIDARRNYIQISYSVDLQILVDDAILWVISHSRSAYLMVAVFRQLHHARSQA